MSEGDWRTSACSRAAPDNRKKTATGLPLKLRAEPVATVWCRPTTITFSPSAFHLPTVIAMPSLRGHCHCGALEYQLNADPAHLRLSAFCHCTRCQRINGAPYVWTTHWAKDAVTWSSQGKPSSAPDAAVQQRPSLRPRTSSTANGRSPRSSTTCPSSSAIRTSHNRWTGTPNRCRPTLAWATSIRMFHVTWSGMAKSPLTPQWPNNARIAVSFVLNYEEGGENLTLNGDQFAELYLTEYGAANGSKPPANVRNLSVESAYEFGSHRGFWRVLDLFRRNGLTFTSWSVGRAVEQNPQVVKAMEDAGCEVASHSYRWFDHSLMSQEEERAQIQAAIRAIKSASPNSREPRGWYTGRQSINTRRLVYQTYKELGLHKELYDSDAYDEDLPYWVPAPDGTPGEHLLVVPYTLDNNDMRFAITPGFFNSESFATYLIDAFETLVAETFLPQDNPLSVPKMMSVGLHCRVVGRPGRFQGLQRFIDHVQRRNAELTQQGNGQGGVWVATRQQIADHWRTHHPPALCMRYRQSSVPGNTGTRAHLAAERKDACSTQCNG
ncbi:hypothetical protein L1887_58198 [Cichorium endivia]|nr:hypothetical protein L1887_58198 [Cichorium endivia]